MLIVSLYVDPVCQRNRKPRTSRLGKRKQSKMVQPDRYIKSQKHDIPDKSKATGEIADPGK